MTFGVTGRLARVAMVAALGLAMPMLAHAEKKYGPGVTDDEILIGQTMPYSGPASAYGTIGRAAAAYFRKLNDEGGINGRKINLISLDDGYSPPKTLEQIRKLVERERVFAIYNPLGTAPNAAIYEYLNKRGVPHLFISSGSGRFNDPVNFPWTMPWLPTYHAEGFSIGEYLLRAKPDGKIAILYQNDDIGRDYVAGIREALGDAADRMIIATESYEVTDTTIDSAVVNLKSSGADVFANLGVPKFAAQAIRRADELGWKPFQYLGSIGSSIAATLKPAGLDKSVGIVTGAYIRDPFSAETQATQGYKDFIVFMEKYYPDGDVKDQNNLIGYSIAQTFEQVIRQAGDNLTRENVMKEAANLKDLVLPMVQPGLIINTGPNDYLPLDRTRLMRFNGERWEPLEG
ncbi:MAG: ABC transporter substrate-binding protein [Pseudomonadota bacterium]|nr:ABC transporter substrate-binding protein [Pseudomonadota bacterium]